MHYARSGSRLQAASAAGWVGLCALMVAQAGSRLDGPHVQMLWTFFAPVLPPLAMLLGYAACVAHFERHRIAFADCFPEAQRRWLMPSRDLFTCARAFGVLCATCWACCAALGASGRPLLSAGALALPPVMYGGVALLLLAPLNVLRRPSRAFFCSTLARVLVPAQPVTWADFLLADILTSLAKSSSDLSRAACLMLHGQLAHPSHPSSAAAAAACGPLTRVTLAALVLPYLLRLVQCVSVWRRGGPTSQLFNALKYASSLPALMLTAMEHEYHVHKRVFPLRRAWLLCMVLNSTYSFYWDVEQDWDMPWLVQHGGRRVLGWLPLPGLRPNHSYSRAWYGWLLASNLVLRFSWAHRLLGDLEAHSSVLMLVALLEVLRRWQWIYVRVETELRRLGALGSHGSGHQLLPTDSEEDLASDQEEGARLRKQPAHKQLGEI